jgi:uncharacterized protein (TIGR02646 family)
MIAIVKDFEAIPKIVFYKPRVEAFEKNKTTGKYCSSDNLYKPDKIKVALDLIYHRKCAYCEKSLKDAFAHIEHYRPKSIYFWLAFSWDNLLLCCDRCNTTKSNKFEIEGEKIVYQGETLAITHSKIKDYDLIEKPLLLNPEQETEASLAEHFTFDLATGKIKSLSKRMEKTIEICDLNREDLLENRMQLLIDLQNALLRRKLDKSKTEFIKSAVDLFTDFKDKIQPNATYLAWRNFIILNWKTFL